MKVGDKVLVTLDSWVIAPDGHQYRAVWGTLKGTKTSEETLGVKTNAKSTNWYLEVGNMIIAGCQVHFAIKSENEPSTTSKRHRSEEVAQRTLIYLAD